MPGGGGGREFYIRGWDREFDTSYCTYGRGGGDLNKLLLFYVNSTLMLIIAENKTLKSWEK